MLLRTAYVRFYRAFNYDYLRKRHAGYEPDPWDKMEDGSFYPYISVDIDPELTCVVGANESGKSQLLQAIECALGKSSTDPADFCRYSTYFTVSEAMRHPHFGLHFNSLTDDETEAIVKLLDLPTDSNISSFRVFRTHPDAVSVYADNKEHKLPDHHSLKDILPSVLRIDAERAVPNSIPISLLANDQSREEFAVGLRRTERWSLIDPIVQGAADLLAVFNDQKGFTEALRNAMQGANQPSSHSTRENDAYRAQLVLAFDLLVTVGGIHPSAFSELHKALRRDDEGLANGIVARMNAQLENSLNLARWWSQDNQFRLAIAVRDFDVVFTIRDRTGSEYSFAERSGGLKYFLSYLVQFLVHVRNRTRPELLLMDEPDAYLSNQGQQDLLKILQEFTLPANDGTLGQVVFVTHSPFLIDKNRGDRIRVLDKGAGDEGVRVVRDVGHNHFEPLRTALGSFVGETAFIGNCNLMVEGLADQVYLAGMSDLLNRDEQVASTDRLDLNHITLVPTGSASHVPYMVYLARGRDADKPAVVVLLDGDKAGSEAIKQLKRGGPHRKQLIRPEYILQVNRGELPDVGSDRPNGPLNIEDLVPVELGVHAARHYISDMGVEIGDDALSTAVVKQYLSKSRGVFEAIRKAVEEANVEVHFEKLGFARNVMEVCRSEQGELVCEMKRRFASFFRHITSRQRRAERERERDSIAARVDREISLFIRDKLQIATKSDVTVLLERISSVIDTSIEGDALVVAIRRLHDEFSLDRSPNDRIADPDSLRQRIERLKYEEILASQPDVPKANGRSTSNSSINSTASAIRQDDDGILQPSEDDSETVLNVTN